MDELRKWGPRLAAHLGQCISLDGDHYELVQFDFESDKLWLRPFEIDRSDPPEAYDLSCVLSDTKRVRLISDENGYDHSSRGGQFKELRTKWAKQLLEAIGGTVYCYGTTYELIQFDFESDSIWLRDSKESESSQPELIYLSAALSNSNFRIVTNNSPYDHGEDIAEQLKPDQEKQEMSKITSILGKCKTAALSAAEYQAGKALNIAMIKAVKPHAPMMVRGYLDHALAVPLLAIGVNVLVEQLPAGQVSLKAQKAAQLMLSAAFLDGADKLLDVEAILSNLLDKLPPETKQLLEA